MLLSICIRFYIAFLFFNINVNVGTLFSKNHFCGGPHRSYAFIRRVFMTVNPNKCMVPSYYKYTTNWWITNFGVLGEWKLFFFSWCYCIYFKRRLFTKQTLAISKFLNVKTICHFSILARNVKSFAFCEPSKMILLGQHIGWYWIWQLCSKWRQVCEDSHLRWSWMFWLTLNIDKYPIVGGCAQLCKHAYWVVCP